ncbi:hypothetical protein QBC41DRAFT_302846 [Cercophora samala]|uniref:Uncharacterized protein n=1 Tax=Cercophora samala TaxID=330535 RepID=A0AA39ZE47_9PEZI|nr:hypothetical protein QBC41DRAFT_302846 [Cercophora samala]
MSGHGITGDHGGNRNNNSGDNLDFLQDLDEAALAFAPVGEQVDASLNADPAAATDIPTQQQDNSLSYGNFPLILGDFGMDDRLPESEGTNHHSTHHPPTPQIGNPSEQPQLFQAARLPPGFGELDPAMQARLEADLEEMSTWSPPENRRLPSLPEQSFVQQDAPLQNDQSQGVEFQWDDFLQHEAFEQGPAQQDPPRHDQLQDDLSQHLSSGLGSLQKDQSQQDQSQQDQSQQDQSQQDQSQQDHLQHGAPQDGQPEIDSSRGDPPQESLAQQRGAEIQRTVNPYDEIIRIMQIRDEDLGDMWEGRSLPPSLPDTLQEPQRSLHRYLSRQPLPRKTSPQRHEPRYNFPPLSLSPEDIRQHQGDHEQHFSRQARPRDMSQQRRPARQAHPSSPLSWHIHDRRSDAAPRDTNLDTSGPAPSKRPRLMDPDTALPSTEPGVTVSTQSRLDSAPRLPGNNSITDLIDRSLSRMVASADFPTRVPSVEEIKVMCSNAIRQGFIELADIDPDRSLARPGAVLVLYNQSDNRPIEGRVQQGEDTTMSD